MFSQNVRHSWLTVLSLSTNCRISTCPWYFTQQALPFFLVPPRIPHYSGHGPSSEWSWSGGGNLWKHDETQVLVKKVTLSFNSSIFQWKIGCLQRGDDRFSSKITFSTKPCSKGEGSWWTWKKTPSNRIGLCFSRSCREDEEGGDAWFQLRILNCFNASWW